MTTAQRSIAGERRAGRTQEPNVYWDRCVVAMTCFQ